MILLYDMMRKEGENGKKPHTKAAVMIKTTDRETASAVFGILADLYPNASPRLQFNTPYELLVAVILSAQCTDERVNKVTRELFPKANTAEKMLLLSQSELERIIYPCGFYRDKARHILSASREIREKYGGELPTTVDGLMTLDGVGRKTANVVASVAFGVDVIAVDTHVFRVSNRLALAVGKTPDEVERGLYEVIPEGERLSGHHRLIYFGREYCRSLAPQCGRCPLLKYCKYNQKRTIGD